MSTNQKEASEAAVAAAGCVRLRDLFYSFFKIGLFTIGGGYAMIPLIEEEVVTRRGWVEQHEFTDLLTIAQSIPGPIALNSAAFVGYKTRGFVGSLIGVLGIVVPAFSVIFVVALFFSTMRENAVVAAAFRAMRPVVVALIVAPTISLMRGMNLVSKVAAVAAMALFMFELISPAILIVVAIVAGAGWTIYMERRLKQ